MKWGINLQLINKLIKYVIGNGARKKQIVSEDGNVRTYGKIEKVMSEAI